MGRKRSNSGGGGGCLLLCLLLVVGGCGKLMDAISGDSEKAAAAEQVVAERASAVEALEEAPVWVGTVVAYDGFIDDMLKVDYGGKYEARVDLAHVEPPEDCGDTDASAPYTAAIHAAYPIGSKIAVVRSREQDGTFGYGDDAGFLHPVVNGAADLLTPSLNERMAEVGVAVPTPDVNARPGEYEDSVADEVERQRGLLSAVDFTYWNKIVAAHLRADDKFLGPVGGCVRQKIARQLETQRLQRQADEEERKRRGRDGIPYTPDDVIPGGGGGSYNVPGWACPTRWC